MVIVICGKRHWLWRAVDNEGTALDFLVQSRRNTKAAKKLTKSLLKKQKLSPTLIVTDYVATIWRDGDKADYRTAARHDIKIESRKVTVEEKLPLRIAPGGGFAIRLTPTS